MIPRYSRALLSLALVCLLAACGGTSATNTPAAVSTSAPASAAAASAPPSASPATATAPRAATPPATPATPRATPGTPGTPTRSASPAATPGTPARPASPTGAGGTVMTDPDNQCQVTLPATFAPDPAGGGNAVSADQRVGVNLLAFPVEAFGFEGTTNFIIGTISASVEGYQETARESGTSRGRPSLSVDFQGSSVGQPVAGQFYFVQEGETVCSLTVVMEAAAASQYATTIDALADSVQAVRP